MDSVRIAVRILEARPPFSVSFVGLRDLHSLLLEFSVGRLNIVGPEYDPCYIVKRLTALTEAYGWSL